MTDETPPRPFDDLRSSGLLWLINRTVFHPRGFALALVRKGDEITGWRLLGDGDEPWTFAGDEDELFRRVKATFAEATAEPTSGGTP